MAWFRRKQMKAPKETKLPKQILKVPGGYRVVGLKTVHSTIEMAQAQLDGFNKGKA